MINEDFLAIIHLNPIELYPPTINAINYINEQCSRKKILVFTTRAEKVFEPYEPKANGNEIIVIREPGFESNTSPVARFITYTGYYWRVLNKLREFNPASILYYETISSLPALIYKKWCEPEVRVHVHYHEYTSPREIRTGSVLNRWCSWFEKKNFRIVNSVSHTNKKRIKLFEDDYGVSLIDSLILPNYPPRGWVPFAKDHTVISETDSLQIVYAGHGLAVHSMYTKEFFTWVHALKGEVSLDCYIRKIEPEAETFLNTLNSPWINIHAGVDYFELPKVLVRYHVGVILYNGHIPNYIHNAPNKLFEYISCGLDVWFPDTMEGCLEYIDTVGSPKVLGLDFRNLNAFDWKQAIRYTGARKQNSFYAESVYCELLSKLFTKLN